MRIARSRGAADGVLLILLGLWGGFVPFVGQYFDYTIGSNHTWDFTWGRLWLSILPAAAVVLGGLILAVSAWRAHAATGGWLALLGGLWFVVGQSISLFWHGGTSAAGPPLGSSTMRAVEEIGWYYGLGALVTAIAAFALGRLAVRTVADERVTEDAAAAEAAAAAERSRFHRPATVDGNGNAEPATTVAAADRVEAVADPPRRRRFGLRR